MEKYLDDEELSPEDIKRAIRKGTLAFSSCRCCAARRSRTRASSRCSTPSSTSCRARSTSRRPRAWTSRASRCSSASRRERAVRGAGVQDRRRPVRQAHLLPGLLGRGRQGRRGLQLHQGAPERLGRILLMHANQREDLEVAMAGDIVAGPRLQGDHHRRHAVRPRPPGDPRAHGVPRARHPRGHRAEDEGRPGQAGQGPLLPVRRGPDVPRPHRRRDRPDRHLRHGRAAPRGAGRPDAARVQRRRHRRQAAGGLPRDDHQGRSATSSTATSSRPVAPASSPTW